MKRLWAPLPAVALAAGWWVTADAGRPSTPPLERAIVADRTTTAVVPALPITTPPTTTVPHTSLTTASPATVKTPVPYDVGTMTLHLVDDSRPTVSNGHLLSASRSLTTLVWYPVVPRRSPLVVFAHGFSVGPAPYEHLCRAWAAAGYVVAAPEFPLTDEAVAGPNLDENDLDNQPADIRFVLTSLLAGSPVATRIDPTRVAVAGHSDGAMTALALADDSTVNARAVMVLSGAPIGRALAHNPAILVAQGDQDAIDPPAQGQAVYSEASAPRFLLHLLGAGHLPPFAGQTRWQPVVDRVTVDFLNRYVAGTITSDDVLLHDGQEGLATIEADP